MLFRSLAVLTAGRCAAVGDPAWPAPIAQSVQAAIAALPPLLPPPAPGQEPFYIGFTSGSSGMPKGFRRHHQSWVESFRVSQHDFGEAMAGRIVAPGSLTASLFLFGALLGLWTGAGSVVQEHFSAERTLRDLASAPATVLVAVFARGMFRLVPILAGVVVGYVLAGKGWFGPETRILLPRLITYVALPPYLMSTIMRAFRRDGLLDFIQGALLPLAAVALTFVLAIIIGRIARVQRQHFGLFCASVSNSNTVFVGIPVNLALFGETSVPYVLLYYAASTVFFWTVGQYSITCDITDNTCCIPLRTRLLQVFSPPLLGFLTGIGLILLGWGIVQVGLSLQSHDPSQRSQGFLTLAGGIIITFAKEILDLIVGTGV